MIQQLHLPARTHRAQHTSRQVGKARGQQAGLTLISLIVMLAILGGIGVIALKVLPTVIEYRAVVNAAKSSKSKGNSVREIQQAFDAAATATYIESISGKDLIISKDENEFEISYAYQKKIPLFGPASLVIDYEGTTAKNGVVNHAKPTTE